MTVRFNPVLGFYRVATGLLGQMSGKTDGFNPVLGFYRVATCRSLGLLQ